MPVCHERCTFRQAGYVPQLAERGLVMPAQDGERAEVEWTLAYGFRGYLAAIART